MYKIIFVSDSHKHFQIAIEEYKKRLGKSLDVLQIKPSKKSDIASIIKEDTTNIIKALSGESGYKIYLDIGGDTFTTEKFSVFIGEKKQKNSKMIFVIGGVHGSSDDIYSHIDKRISLSTFTFPHGAALLMILEQIYRIETIFIGKKYHY